MADTQQQEATPAPQAAPQAIDNMALWNSLSVTDPAHVKPISGKDYTGTSPKPHWIVMRLTERFGPAGIGWGIKILSERMESMGQNEAQHVAVVQLWYEWQGKRGEVEHIGQTKAMYVTKQGTIKIDEDAAKKSVTDAMVKCASFVGVCADIFLGRWDDQKYVDEARNYWGEQKAGKPKSPADRPSTDKAPPAGKTRKAPPPPTLEEIAGMATDIERANEDGQLVSLSKQIYGFGDYGLITIEHLKELCGSIVRRRSELVPEAGFAQFQKMVSAFKDKGWIDRAQGQVAVNLARTRLNIVE